MSISVTILNLVVGRNGSAATLPAGYFSTFSQSVSGNAGSGAFTMDQNLQSGQKSLQNTFTGITTGTNQDLGMAQFISYPFTGTTSISASNWAINFSIRVSNAASNFTWKGKAALYLINGTGVSAGTIKTTIFSLADVGSTGRSVNGTTTLNGALTSGATTITVVSTAGFSTSGSIIIDSPYEVVAYTGTNGTQFTGCTRGQVGTVGAAHATGANVISGYTCFANIAGAAATSATSDYLALELGVNLNNTSGGTLSPNVTIYADGGTAQATDAVSAADHPSRITSPTSLVLSPVVIRKQLPLAPVLQQMGPGNVRTQLPSIPVEQSRGPGNVRSQLPNNIPILQQRTSDPNIYRMRGFDSNSSVNRIVYWVANKIDATAAQYTGSIGPVTDVVVAAVIET